MPDYAALGRSGALQQASRDIIQGASMLRQQRKEDAAEKEGDIRVPIPKMGPTPRAVTTPIAEAIAAREEPASIPEAQVMEEAAAKQQHEQVTAELEEQKEQEVRAVDTLPVMQNLKQMPTAYNRMMEIARANGWIQNIGGVDTISNKQMRIAQGIIASDLKMNKEINELALGDITQNIVGLEQSMLDPKMKAEEKAQVQAQIDTLKAQQNSYLNAVNMMDREIQKELATRVPVVPKEKPFKTKTEPLGDGLFQDWERIEGKWEKFGKPYKKGKASEGWGASEWNSYRQFLKQAETAAYRDIFANDPKFKYEIAELEAGELTEAEQRKLEARLHTALTESQRAELDNLTEKYLASKTPKPILREYLSAKKRGEKHTVESNPLGLPRVPRK